MSANSISAADQEALNNSLLGRMIRNSNFQVHAWSVQVLVIFGGSIYGGIVAYTMFATVGFSVVQLAFIFLCTIIPNAFAIGQIPMKTMIPVFMSALAINTVIIIYNLIVLMF